ncbi:1,6-anhydro-N-acetylmuramyl-L-alanine amidase AmpD [Gammaproteobacteria bacterium AB-CW1]|uniref:1,6-anhydro-N-acetylmuramyl-L-alanine amidase AmpD n=1 Tax=Natronospira elongata TaxID=3110268 RepID=A0AAP6MK59_9GAMM|nr:1,6-anhydro-N-acetylmuramyl-L-alanine amidase AmpD [Gammaproteobacteria bacterium AB-CW1]
MNRLPQIHNGWMEGAARHPSPNADHRPPDCEPSLLVIHAISLPPGEFGGPWVDKLFLNRLPADGHPFFKAIEGLRVSSHLFIRRDGSLVQYVPFHRRAWHAGRSRFQGRRACNDIAIGIELEGTDDLPFTDAQYRRLSCCAASLLLTYPAITPERMVGHNHIAPGRKTDPGPHFSWFRFRNGAVGMGT